MSGSLVTRLPKGFTKVQIPAERIEIVDEVYNTCTCREYTQRGWCKHLELVLRQERPS